MIDDILLDIKASPKIHPNYLSFPLRNRLNPQCFNIWSCSINLILQLLELKVRLFCLFICSWWWSRLISQIGNTGFIDFTKVLLGFSVKRMLLLSHTMNLKSIDLFEETFFQSLVLILLCFFRNSKFCWKILWISWHLPCWLLKRTLLRVINCKAELYLCIALSIMRSLLLHSWKIF